VNPNANGRGLTDGTNTLGADALAARGDGQGESVVGKLVRPSKINLWPWPRCKCLYAKKEYVNE